MSKRKITLAFVRNKLRTPSFGKAYYFHASQLISQFKYLIRQFHNYTSHPKRHHNWGKSFWYRKVLNWMTCVWKSIHLLYCLVFGEQQHNISPNTNLMLNLRGFTWDWKNLVIHQKMHYWCGIKLSLSSEQIIATKIVIAIKCNNV